MLETRQAPGRGRLYREPRRHHQPPQGGLAGDRLCQRAHGQHDEKWFARFAAAVTALPEVQEFHRMSGDVDYLLKVVTSDIEGYDRFYKKLIKSVQLTGVSSAFSMEQIKITTSLPLELVSHQ
jgi:DNA-binding Lrp family transcriptional regulator